MGFINYLMEAEITKEQFIALEKYLDEMFRALGIDVAFTKHFMERVNDPRNGSQITVGEIASLFQREYSKWGIEIKNMRKEAEALMRQRSRSLNLPFVLGIDKKTGRGLQLRPITIMRKSDFKTHDKVFDV